MPRYYFNVRDGTDIVDDTGTELPDIYAAQNEAIRFSGELLKDLGAKFWNEGEWKMEVTDDKGVSLFVLRFSAEDRIPSSSARSSKP